jgi:peptidoglycan/LPS O-acetylase OafA/YrhL
MEIFKEVNYKQADALRGILTLFVIASHWIPHGRVVSENEQSVLEVISLIGAVGMYFFFVLSGFLITGILVRNKIKAEDSGYSKKEVWKSFFMRRTLRIFPIYYLCLAFLIYFNVGWIRGVSGWHISYLSNIFFYKENSWGLGGHLWSLSCEEQFYLAWPLLILFLPLRYLKMMIISFVLIAPIFRMTMNFYNPSIFTQLLTPAVFDGLGLGALLAIHKNIPKYFIPEDKIKKVVNYSGLIGILLLLFFYISPGNLDIWNEFHPFHDLFFRSSMAMVGLFLVFGSINGFKSIWTFILENRIVLYLGKISYSLYLFHNFQLYLFEWFKVPLPTSGWFLIIHFAILLFLSTLSWYFFELPINNLKRYFPYIKKR